MTITRADVADLRAGDVVELVRSDWSGVVTRGPVAKTSHGDLLLADLVLLWSNGSVPGWAEELATLTVITRAKPPLYVNSDKTEPDPGDVVRDADSDGPQVWHCADRSEIPWITTTYGDHDWWDRDGLPDRLRLLVDGRTGQVAPTAGRDSAPTADTP